MKPDVIIAIDPDVKLNGYAELHTDTRIMHVKGLSFPVLMDILRDVPATLKDGGGFANVIVYVEAGYLNRPHWHLKDKDSKRVVSAKGNAVGRNHEVARLIVQMAKHYGCNVEEVYPLKKCWKGKDGKITQEEIEQITGMKGRTNQEMRDAALIAWVKSGLPMRMKVR
jgi:hypothetical protein